MPTCQKTNNQLSGIIKIKTLKSRDKDNKTTNTTNKQQTTPTTSTNLNKTKIDYNKVNLQIKQKDSSERRNLYSWIWNALKSHFQDEHLHKPRGGKLAEKSPITAIQKQTNRQPTRTTNKKVYRLFDVSRWDGAINMTKDH